MKGMSAIGDVNYVAGFLRGYGPGTNCAPQFEDLADMLDEAADTLMEVVVPAITVRASTEGDEDG